MNFEKILSENPPLQRLKGELLKIAPEGRLTIAFSGGVDSRFLSFAAKLMGFNVELIHAKGIHIPQEETEYAVAWAKNHELPLLLIEADPLSDAEVAVNARKRCFYCKKAIFAHILRKARSVVCDGTNHSDLGENRPGLLSLKELHIASPLAAAGISKSDIRLLGALIGLERPEQPSAPCLLTRLPYGTRIVPDELFAIAHSEKRIRSILSEKIGREVPFRVRKTAPNMLEIHFAKRDAEEFSSELKEALVGGVRRECPAGYSVLWNPQEKLSGFFDRLDSASGKKGA